MSIIVRTWELRDFCGSHGRVIPHCTDVEGHFTVFHCADRSHDDSPNIICSEEQGPQKASMSGILSMKGYVVEFENKDEYLFCTKTELERLEQKSNQEKEERQKRKRETPHIARPVGIKITSDIQDRRYQSYAICPDFKIKKESLNFIKIPTHLGSVNYKDWVCEDDCIFPNCPFYDKMHFDEYRYNHRNDYDTWVVEFSKNAPGIHSQNSNVAVESPQEKQPSKEENENNGMQVRNKKSVRQLCAEQQDCIDFIRNPDNGKVFFECGEILGYVSPNAASRAMEPDATIDDFRFEEVSKDGGNTYIPCIMERHTKERRKDIIKRFTTGATFIQMFTSESSNQTPTIYDDDLPF